MIVTRSFAGARSRRSGRTGLVPTMGFLHEGHVALLDEARRNTDTVVMSLFVNPLQFGDPADLASYPADLDRDVAIAEAAGVDVVFAPLQDDMYPVPPVTRVVLPEMNDRMEGLHRPGHFDGVATVVTKLFAGLQPDVAFFGRKDAQQVAVVRRMTADLSLPVAIEPVSTRREPDGLALSSRNVRLDPSARRDALAIVEALMAAADAVEAGETDAAAVASGVWDRLVTAPGVDPEYAEWADQSDLTAPTIVAPGIFLAVAAVVDGVRLIDNIHVDGDVVRPVVDRGVRGETVSMLYEREVW